MIPFVIFITLLAIGVILFLYFMLDNKNRIYGNIVAAFLCALVFGYLAIISIAPVVITTPVINTTSTTTVNGTVTTSFIYDTPTVTSSSEGYIFLLISVVVMIYTFLMIYEAYAENKRGVEED
jgi:hypothetical protein